MLVGSVARSSLAAESASSVQLDYEVARGCPGEEAFTSALVARGVRVERSPSLPKVRVWVRFDGGRFFGALTISSASGPWLAREIEARDCSEITSAFALVAAVTAAHGGPDPAALAAPVEPATAPVAPAAPSPRLPEALPPPLPVALATESPVVTLDSGPRVSEGDESAPSPFALRRYTFGIGTLLQSGVLPAFGAGVLVFGERSWKPESSFSPLVALSLAWSRQELTRIGLARFDWLLARTAVCPWEWPRSGIFRLRPCAAVEGGILRGEGIGVRAAASSTAWWLAPGVGSRAQVDWDWLRLGASVALFAPLFRDRFYFGPDVTVHRSELVTLSSEITLGVRFR